MARKRGTKQAVPMGAKNARAHAAAMPPSMPMYGNVSEMPMRGTNGATPVRRRKGR